MSNQYLSPAPSHLPLQKRLRVYALTRFSAEVRREGAPLLGQLLTARYQNSKALNDAEYRSEELTKMLETIERVLRDLERTRANPIARRDLQLRTQLEGLGYVE